MADPSVPVAPIPDGFFESLWADAGLPSAIRPYLAFQTRRYPSVARELARLGRLDGREVLDLGGGVGSLAISLHAQLGGTFDLADLDAPTETHASALRARGVRAGYAVDLTALHPLEKLPASYDGILLVEVLEHLLVNPLFLFREIWDHLKPGGFLFVTTPNQARLRNRLRLLVGRTIKEPGRYPRALGIPNGHVIEFTLPELNELAAIEGFSPLAHRIAQQVPSVRPSATQRLGVGLLNGRIGRRFALGDDLLALYRKVDRPRAPRTDASGRV